MYIQSHNTPHPLYTHQVDVYTPLRNVIKQVWALWELMMLAQPLLVVGPSPGALC